MIYKRYGITLLLFLTAFGFSYSQDFSNKGREFWLAFSYHVGMVERQTGVALPTMTLYITSDVNTSFKVESGTGTSIQTGNITAGQVVSVVIPSSYFIDNEGKFTDKAIRVTANDPVVVYSYITRSLASAATLCLPTNVLGREYYSSSFTQLSNEPNSNSFITIVAVEDNTTVEITPSAATKSGRPAGQTFSINLNKGEIYQLLGTAPSTPTGSGYYIGSDLSGTHIVSVSSGTEGCKKIAVFSGSGKIMLTANNCSGNSSDNLYQQLYPVASWGLKYLTVPSYNRPTNVYRVTKSDPAANVYVNGSLIPAGSFVNNLYYQFYNKQANIIQSDKPISVAQYFTTQGCDGNGTPYDPDMIMLNPVEQNIDKVTLVSSNLLAPVTQSNGTQIPHQHHIHVIMHNGGTGISSFKLDGAPVAASSWVPHPGDPNYSYLYLSNVSQGYHRIESDSGFNAIAYGYANAETYGYSAGANVKDLYQFASIKNEYATVDFPAACTNSPFYFRMTFPYQPTQIKWVFGTALNGIGIKDTTINTPLYDSSWVVNGKTLYRYTLPDPYSINTIGNYPIQIIAKNATSEGCSGEQEVNYTLQVFGRPVADFNFTTTGCLPDNIKFNDVSSTGGRPAYIWRWKVSDGRTSSDQSPSLPFNAAGQFAVSLSVITDIGCISETQTKTVEINTPPVASFDISTPTCETKPITITDKSTTGTGIINQWVWNMGDAGTVTKTTGAAFPYTYAAAGTYTVTLSVKTDKGCSSTLLSKTLSINPQPVAGFSMPGNCLADPFTQFKDTSKIAGGNSAGFTYLWNFGDQNATAANPNTSTDKDPKHKYTAVGNYNVGLTVTTQNGCVSSVNQQFTINGAQPQSVFTIQGGNQQCSNNIVTVKNNSTVDFGKVIQLEIYWDYANNPTDKTVINNPPAGGSFTHTYPEFYTPLTKDYTVKVIAYSGESCLNEKAETLTMKATPDVLFSPLTPVCADVAPFQLGGASTSNNFSGTGIFSGKGVSSTGMFDPKAAGAGTFLVRYTFNGTNGCSNYKEQPITVHPLPEVDAGPDRFMLEGGSTTLQATASGNNLNYTWSPSTALSDPRVLQPIASPVEETTYKLEAESADGCSAFDEVVVKVLKMPAIPNVFTPNGDGINDKWEIAYLESYPGSSVKVFNRYGQLVFESKGYGKPWDGKYNGKDLPAGTYYYIVDPKNGRKQIAGYVDIVR